MDALRIIGKFSNVMEQETQKGILNRYSDISEVGMNLQKISDMKKIKLKFILVVKNAEDITWLAGPLAELKARLLPMRKIWGIELAVLNEELAGAYGLTC